MDDGSLETVATLGKLADDWHRQYDALRADRDEWRRKYEALCASRETGATDNADRQARKDKRDEAMRAFVEAFATYWIKNWMGDDAYALGDAARATGFAFLTAAKEVRDAAAK